VTNPAPREVTQLLAEWSGGDEAALGELLPLVEKELRRLAHQYMRRERAGHTLQTTALINEAYLRLAQGKQAHFQSRAHFFAVAANLMRQIMVDHARARQSAKRGGGARQVSLDEAALVCDERAAELLALDEALEELARSDPRKSRVVELRYFGGLSVEETAGVLKVHPNTVLNDWREARAWLYCVLGGEGA
jgi:RNA polymerase sigma-70 factor, ECF subfamily